MNLSTSLDPDATVIHMAGRFDFTCHRQFKDVFEPVLADSGSGNLVLNMQALEYMDSSALGMLLLVRERSQAASKVVQLRNCNGRVLDVLRVAKFDRLFGLA